VSQAVDLAALLLGLVAFGAAGTLLAACLRPMGSVAFLLTTVTIAWASLVATLLLLSPLVLVTRGWLLGTALVLVAVATAVWQGRGRPRPPSLRQAARTAFEAVRTDPALAVLAALVAAGTAYVVALAFATPPLDYDALLYHLPRAALWRQQHAVGYIAGASDPRLDGNPPGAELGLLATMVLSRGDRLVAVPQIVGLTTCCLATFGIARRIGLDLRQALFGSLLVATLPLVAIQASTAYNDLVVAGFLATAAHAVLGRTRADLVVLALSLGLALTTKFSAILALPLLALVAAVGAERSRWPALLAAGGSGLLLGAPWYVLNLVETGSLDGGLDEVADQRQPAALLEIATTFRRHLFSFLDFSGVRDLELTTVYGLAAIVVLGIGIGIGATLLRGRRARTILVAVGAAVVVFLPRLLVEVADGTLRAWYKAWTLVGRSDIAEADSSWQPQTAPDAGLSWYGPVASILLGATAVLVVLAVRRRRLPVVCLVLAAAPFVLAAIFAVTVTWDPFRGRLLAFGVLLSATTWGLALRHRELAWGAVALAVVTLPLALAGTYGKPAGIFGWPEGSSTVWGKSRAELLAGRFAGHGVVAAARALDAADDDTVAVAPQIGEIVYPLLDPHGARRTVLVPVDGGHVPDDAEWLVLGPGSRVERCGGWRVTTRTDDGWVVARRGSGDTTACAIASGGPG
jgi:hypothetical protein